MDDTIGRSEEEVSKLHQPKKEYHIDGYSNWRKLGNGAMADTYLVYQINLRRDVVFKVLNETSSKYPEVVDRFLQEGRILAKLKHPSIVTVHDVFEIDKQYFLSMEHLPGSDLSDYVKKNGPLAPHTASSMLITLAKALEVIHRNRITHRDIKPANILVNENLEPTLIDFGIARNEDQNLTIYIEEEPDKDNSATDTKKKTNTLLGSPAYMAPELWRGEPATGASDYYSLGCVFYFLLTGNLPYSAHTRNEIRENHLHAPPPKLPRQVKHYQPVFNALVRKNAEHRLADPEKLKELITTCEKNKKRALFKLKALPTTIFILASISAGLFAYWNPTGFDREKPRRRNVDNMMQIINADFSNDCSDSPFAAGTKVTREGSRLKTGTCFAIRFNDPATSGMVFALSPNQVLKRIYPVSCLSLGRESNYGTYHFPETNNRKAAFTLDKERGTERFIWLGTESKSSKPVLEKELEWIPSICDSTATETSPISYTQFLEKLDDIATKNQITLTSQLISFEHE